MAPLILWGSVTWCFSFICENRWCSVRQIFERKHSWLSQNTNIIKAKKFGAHFLPDSSIGDSSFLSSSVFPTSVDCVCVFIRCSVREHLVLILSASHQHFTANPESEKGNYSRDEIKLRLKRMKCIIHVMKLTAERVHRYQNKADIGG